MECLAKSYDQKTFLAIGLLGSSLANIHRIQPP